MTVECCATCRFFETAEEDTPFATGNPNDTERIRNAGGSCHRHAPAPLAGGSGTGWSDWEWPAVRPGDLCGEWLESL